jgi:hypothetical protein
VSRFRKLTLVIAASVLLLAGGLLWALPEIVRRVALDRIPRVTGRAVAIGDIDLNLFTGRLAIKGFRLADRPGPEPFVELERLDVRVAPLALLRAHVLVRDIALVAPTVRVVRTGPAELNFSDLLVGTTEPAPDPVPAPSRWTVTVERLHVARGRIDVDDRAVSPPAEWLVQDLDIAANGLTTRTGATPGQLTIRTKVNEAVLTVSADPLRLDPNHFRIKLSLDGFETRRLTPYVYTPLSTPYRPVGGRLAIALMGDVDSDLHQVHKATLAGTLTLEREAFAAVGRSDPFVAASRLGVEIREADLIARTLNVASVTIEGLDLKARRDARGVIDVLEMFTPKASGAAVATREGTPVRPAPPTPGAPRASPGPPGSNAPPVASTAPGDAPPAQPTSPPGPPDRRALFPIIRELGRGFHQIHVEQITLAPSAALFVDERVTPTARLALTKLQARLDDLTWPVRRPARFTLSTGLPGGGTLNIKGPVTVAPFDANVTIAIRSAPVEPYQPYIPIPAQLSGRYGGDSQNRIAFRDGKLVAQSKGNSWAENVEIREPGATRPAIRVERMELRGIDFDWPRRAGFARAGFRRPRVEIERGVDGTFNVRRLFTAPGPEGAPEPEPKPTGAPAASEPKGLYETMRLDFREVRIEDGFIRFLDRTVTPAFSQDLSRLEVTLTDYGNRPDRRAKVVLQSVVGGDGGLDIRGELGPLGAPAALDLVGELRSFKLPSVDPYAVATTGWLVRQGELQYKLLFKLDGNQLSAENDLVVGRLQVAPATGSDEVKRRIGLPLGLIVALIKDQRGDIRVNVPVAGPINDPKFSLGDAIWTAIKNVLTNVVTAPFKAIGRLFSKGDETEKALEPKVDPVTFAAGSAVLSPAMEDHLLRVADVLRRAPYVNLALTAVPSPGDAEALKNDAVTARLEALRKERALPDAASAVAAYYKERLPEVPVPSTVEEQVALLREREPAPEASLADLGRRRMETTRERLVTVEGIPAARLTDGEATRVASPDPGPAQSAPDLTGAGRVEFAIVAGQ